jgi:signal transduction histidine kinase/ActR/RegA family two-component response regulator
MRVFTARETGVATMAWSAAQDPSGTMYFGCDTVVSFDGDRWRTEKMDATYLVRGLDVAPDGRIWAAGVNQIGWFEPGGRGRLEYHSLMPRIPAGAADLGDVWRVYAQGGGGAIFVARERILRWDGRRFEAWDYPGMNILWSTRTARAVYVHYPPLGLLVIGREGPSVAVPASVIGASEVRWLDDSGGDLLLLTPQGFKRLHAGACAPLDTEASAFARSNTPTSVARLGDGSLAIGTLQGGIAIVSPEGAVRRVFNLKAGLPANQIYSLFVDHDGALWATGPSQIVRLAAGSDTAVYGQRSGYPPGGCCSVDEYSGTVFAVSHSELFRLGADPQSGGAGQFEALGTTSSRFYSLLSTPQGLVVGHFHGLGIWSPAGMRPLVALDDVVFRTTPSRARPGRILASLFDRVLSVDPQSGGSAVVADGLPDYGDSVADEPSGRVWIGTPSKGLFVAGPGSTRSVPAGPRYGPVASTGTAFVTQVGARIVVLTKGAAFLLDESRERFLPIAGVPQGSPAAVSNPDGGGGAWAAIYPDEGGHSPRLGRISLAGEGAVWTPQSLEGLSGAGSVLGLRVIHAQGRDDLFISGTESLVRAGPAALSPRPPPRVPSVRAWASPVGGRPGEPVAGALPYSTQGIHIEYSSLDYAMRESESFQTMLGGVESQWSPPTQSAERDISGLREGSYDFRVRLVTDSGEVGEAALLHFSIAPPWWATNPARVAFGLGAGIGILGLLRFRTRALKRRAEALEEIVRRRTEELEKASAAKTEFVASMSHEIRNPMGGIVASAVALSEMPLAPEQLRLVATIRSCAGFLTSLVEDVLDFASIEAGAYRIAPSPISPREVLENVANMLEARSPGSRIEVAVDARLPERILGDGARIQQVIVNFAVNSLKFGGRTVRLSAEPEGSDIAFTVADDGIGIPPEEQKNLFIRFSRLKSARTLAIPGTGLGLAVCRALAERMGGSVGCTSAVGKGSTFHLRIPLEAGPRSALEFGAFDALGARALVVEDIDYNARALGLMLERLGFRVEFAQDGEEALERLASATYQVALIDCDLPRVSGIEVARRFRASEAPRARTYLVATTALSTVADRNSCMAAGMDAFISKPLTPEKLRTALIAFNGSGPQAPPAAAPFRPAPAIPGIRLELLLHLSDGSALSLARELERFAASLGEAVQQLDAAHASLSRPATASAAHRVLSLARMVGAAELCEAASDLQGFAKVYTDAELAREVGLLKERAERLRSQLARAREEATISPSSAS